VPWVSVGIDRERFCINAGRGVAIVNKNKLVLAALLSAGSVRAYPLCSCSCSSSCTSPCVGSGGLTNCGTIGTGATPEVTLSGGAVDLSDAVPGWTLKLDDLFE
jgi:hypothetical protein